jgi:HK97 family phage prohead protease
MDAKKREVRTIECELAIREAPQNAQGESRTIAGTAIVFNKESEVLDDWGEEFREMILPEACTAGFLQSQDIKLNLLHERELAIARSIKGQGSLRLNVDGTGVHFEFEAPRCDLGDRALELIRTGVYSGCSFEFYPQDYDVEERDGEVLIKHRKFAALTALTIGMDPAYRQTTVNARELAQPKETEEQRKEREAKEAAEAAEVAKREQEQKAEEMRRETLRRAENLKAMSNFDEINF